MMELEQDKNAEKKQLVRQAFSPSRLAGFGIALGVGSLVMLCAKMAGITQIMSADALMSVGFGFVMGVVTLLRDRNDYPDRPLAMHVGLAILQATLVGFAFYLLNTLF
jgi:hypothetical protein